MAVENTRYIAAIITARQQQRSMVSTANLPFIDDLLVRSSNFLILRGGQATLDNHDYKLGIFHPRQW